MPYPVKYLKSAKGLSIVSIFVFAAVLYVALNVYSYFNPSFELSQYSVVRFFKARVDEQRKEDLKRIKTAIDIYRSENDYYPAPQDWCGRIVSVLHPEVKDVIADQFENNAIPQDPSFKGTHKDYFYKHVDRNTYVLMAVLEDVPDDTETYSFTGCYDWPGDGVYNYRIIGGEQ